MEAQENLHFLGVIVWGVPELGGLATNSLPIHLGWGISTHILSVYLPIHAKGGLITISNVTHFRGGQGEEEVSKPASPGKVFRLQTMAYF